jgi:hypothetical protein
MVLSDASFCSLCGSVQKPINVDYSSKPNPVDLPFGLGGKKELPEGKLPFGIENSPIEIKNTPSALKEEIQTDEQLTVNFEPVEGSQNELEVTDKSVPLPFGIDHIPIKKSPNLAENTNKVQINPKQKLPFGIEHIVDKSE